MKIIRKFIILIVLLFIVLPLLKYLLIDKKITSNIKTPKPIMTNSWIKFE